MSVYLENGGRSSPRSGIGARPRGVATGLVDVVDGPFLASVPSRNHAFSRLLEWLDDGVDSHGETYIEMRRRLVLYFDRRNRLSADELADETLNRVCGLLERTGAIAITPPARYCYVVARFVLLEDFRRDRRHVSLDESRSADAATARGAKLLEEDEGLAIREQRLECLDRCLQKLKPEQRELVVEYYRDARRQKIERRQDIAKRLGITKNALGIRACRIRRALEACVEACCMSRMGDQDCRGPRGSCS